MKLGKTIYLKDKNNRILLSIKGKRVLAHRYVGMDEKTKKLIIEIFLQITEKTHKEIKSFLNFKSEESEFCS